MLAWNAILEKIEIYTQKRVENQARYKKLRDQFVQYYRDCLATDWEYWKERADDPRHAHLIPDFDESPGIVYPVEPKPEPGIVLATDGSQIFPSRHEIDPIALLNISRIRINYKHYQEEPLLDAIPSVLTRSDFDLNIEASFHDIVSDQRSLQEIQTLAALAESVAQNDVPSIALTDGSLIFWRLAGREMEKYEKDTVDSYVSALRQFQETGVPMAGYISASGSREVVHLLALIDAAHEKGCDPALGITDTALFSRLLNVGERSIVFYSRSKILQHYRDQRVAFFFLHVGSEIAKIEIPLWVATNNERVDQVASTCYYQAKIGGGYPMVLTEAHEHAVIRSADRDTFYALLEESFRKEGLAVSPSAKQQSKRTPWI